MNGTLVTLSGIDGSGKSTIAKKLVKRLEEDGYNCSYHYGRYTAKLARPIMLAGELYLQSESDGDYEKYAEEKSNLLGTSVTEMAYETVLMVDYLPFLFSSVKLKLARNDYVICDRYFYDTILKNFGGGIVQDAESAASLVEKYDRFVPDPDHSYFLDISADLAMDRKDDIPSHDYIDHQKKLYSEFIEYMDVRTLDGSKTVDGILNKIYADIK